MKKLLVSLAAGLLLLAGCNSSDDTFVYTITAPVESMDTVNSSYDQTLTLLTDIYLGATKFDGDGELIMGGADSIDVSEDGLTYTIHLRDDVKWVDNTGAEVGDVTANDYVTGYKRMVDPEEASIYSYIFEIVENASSITAGEKDIDSLGVKAIDDYTLEIDLSYAAPYFESMLSFASYMPVATKAVAEYGDEYGTSAETTWYNGAYYVTSYDPDYVISLEKNPSYINADSVEVSNIEYRLNEDTNSRYNTFLNDEIDYAQITNSEDYSDGKEQGIVEDHLTGFSYYVVMNQAIL